MSHELYAWVDGLEDEKSAFAAEVCTMWHAYPCIRSSVSNCMKRQNLCQISQVNMSCSRIRTDEIGDIHN